MSMRVAVNEGIFVHAVDIVVNFRVLIVLRVRKMGMVIRQ